MSLLLGVEQLSVKLQDKVILSELNLSLQRGEILGLVGASGCGKTTLLNTIAGFAKPCEGAITIDNNVIVGERKYVPTEERQIGVIFQDYALFPHLTVRENIAFGISKLSNEQQHSRINNLLATLKLTEYSEKHIHQLSGGQQQRVAIARALAPEPKLLLLDEPFSNIDARLRNELMIEIRLLLKKINTTAIFVTHNKDEVFTFADKMAVMAQGKLLQFDSPTVVCQTPNSYQVADFLQLGSWLPCNITSSGVNTLLGEVSCPNVISQYDTNKSYCLLVKPQQLIVNTDIAAINTNSNANSIAVNAQVDHISITEQGYHYHLSSVDIGIGKHELSFQNLSLYSEQSLVMGQQISLGIKAHQPLVFCAS